MSILGNGPTLTKGSVIGRKGKFKSDSAEITLTLDVNEEISPKAIEEIVDIPIEQIDLSKLKTKELIFELKNSLISGFNIYFRRINI